MTGYKYKPNECPNGCPKCGFKDILKQDEDGLDEFSQDWRCYTCGFRWTEIYTFKSWYPDEEQEYII